MVNKKVCKCSSKELIKCDDALEAYGDMYLSSDAGSKIRNLSWKSSKLRTPEEACKCMRFIGEYNFFNPEQTCKALKNTKIKVQLAREGSVALYLKGSKEETDKVVKKLTKKHSPDEYSYDEKNKEARLWWD